MPKQLALFFFISFILYLFYKDSKLRPMSSQGLWIPLLWLIIIASRPVSLWFGQGFYVDNPDDYLAGSPFDRNVFMLLTFAGLLILLKRKVSWNNIFKSNFWVFTLFIYCLLSIAWSG